MSQDDTGAALIFGSDGVFFREGNGPAEREDEFACVRLEGR